MSNIWDIQQWNGKRKVFEKVEIDCIHVGHCLS